VVACCWLRFPTLPPVAGLHQHGKSGLERGKEARRRVPTGSAMQGLGDQVSSMIMAHR